MGRRWYAILALVALLIGWGDYQFAKGAQVKLNQFETQVCTISTASRANSLKLKGFMVTLAGRAEQREQIDNAAGNTTAAQADHDSALLYRTIAASIKPSPGPGLGC